MGTPTKFRRKSMAGQNGANPAQPTGPNICPVARGVGMIMVPVESLQADRTGTLQRVQQMQLQTINVWHHEWRYHDNPPERTEPWYCVFCCEWRSPADVPMMREEVAAADRPAEGS